MGKNELYLCISWWNFKILKIEQEVLQSSNVDKIGYLQRNESRLQDFHPRNHPSNIFKDLRNVNLNIEFYI